VRRIVDAMTDTSPSKRSSLFVAERYISSGHAQVGHEDAQRAQAVSRDLAGRGTAIRYLGSIFVPQDETCFAFFEAGSAAEVRSLANQAFITYHRIVHAQHLGNETITFSDSPPESGS
jgi:hypothetical protein